MPDGQWNYVAASNLSTVKYVGGPGAGSDTIYIAAYDATVGSWTGLSVVTASTVAASNTFAHAGSAANAAFPGTVAGGTFGNGALNGLPALSTSWPPPDGMNVLINFMAAWAPGTGAPLGALPSAPTDPNETNPIQLGTPN